MVRELFPTIHSNFFAIASTPTLFNSPARLSDDNIYAALRTIDLSNLGENRPLSSVLSTPTKQQQFLPSTPDRSPSIPYRSPSIPYRSPLRNRFLQTPTHGQTMNGTIE